MNDKPEVRCDWCGKPEQAGFRRECGFLHTPQGVFCCVGCRHAKVKPERP